ncbi:MAG: hypothetical protein J6R59_00200 [Paludibacteraceae bacterium]|nr:hypothetical protein [Paludibacteraceae bacterium]
MYNRLMTTYAEEYKLVTNELTKRTHVKITKDVRRFTIEPDFLGIGEQEETYYIVTCYVDGEEIDSVSTQSIIEAGEIAQSYETFIKYYNQN